MMKNWLTKDCVQWIKNYFEITNGKKAIIGISGGKDSTVCAALCCQAIGAENVIGVIMPNGEQTDIKDSYEVCDILHINKLECNINPIYNKFDFVLSECRIDLNKSKQAYTNLSPRIRTTLLYAIAQMMSGGRVCNTSNLCEKEIGWGTLWADTVGDFSPLGNLTVSEIKNIGYDLDLPKHLIDKAPADGLTGKIDEDNFGFTYAELEKVIKKYLKTKDIKTDFFDMIDDLGFERSEKILKMIKNSQFKRDMIHIPTFDPSSNVTNND